mgnify:CR=1 FL=1
MVRRFGSNFVNQSPNKAIYLMLVTVPEGAMTAQAIVERDVIRELLSNPAAKEVGAPKGSVWALESSNMLRYMSTSIFPKGNLLRVQIEGEVESIGGPPADPGRKMLALESLLKNAFS